MFCMTERQRLRTNREVLENLSRIHPLVKRSQRALANVPTTRVQNFPNSSLFSLGNKQKARVSRRDSGSNGRRMSYGR